MISREQELWALALWVEKNHRDDAADFIGQQVARLTSAGDADGVAMWNAVADRYAALQNQQAHA